MASPSALDGPTTFQALEVSQLLDPQLRNLIVCLSTRILPPERRRDAIRDWFQFLLTRHAIDYGTQESFERVLLRYSRRPYQAGTAELKASEHSIHDLQYRNGDPATHDNGREHFPWGFSTEEETFLNDLKGTMANSHPQIVRLKSEAHGGNLWKDRGERVLETESIALILAVLTDDAKMESEALFCLSILTRVQKFSSDVILKAALFAVADLSINCQAHMLSEALCLVPNNMLRGWQFSLSRDIPGCLYLDAALSVFHEFQRERRVGIEFCNMRRTERDITRDDSAEQGRLSKAVELICIVLRRLGIAVYRAAVYILFLISGRSRRLRRLVRYVRRTTRELKEMERTRPLDTFIESWYEIDLAEKNQIEDSGGLLRGLAKHGVTFLHEDENDRFVRVIYGGRPSCFLSEELRRVFRLVHTIRRTPTGVFGRMSATRHVAVWGYILLSISSAVSVVVLNPANRESALERSSDFVWVLTTLLISVFGLVKLVSGDPNVILNILCGRKALLSVDDVVHYLDIPDLIEGAELFSELKSVLAVYPSRIPWLESFETSFLREEPCGEIRLLGGVDPCALAGVGIFVTDNVAFDIMNQDGRTVSTSGNNTVTLSRKKLVVKVVPYRLQKLSERTVI